MTLAAGVDIGTNSTRLLIGDVVDGRVDQITREMLITRLGRGVDATGLLEEESIARTLEVLERYATECERAGVESVRIAATSACRDAANRDDFLAPAGRLFEEFGAAPEILSGSDEAVLSYLGATAEYEGPWPVVVVDIGGGSTEISIGKGARTPERWVSLDIGCVRLSERHFHHDPPEPEELSNALSEVRDLLVSIESELDGETPRSMIGLAGTITTLATLDLGLDAYDGEKIQSHRLTSESVESLFRYLARSTVEERRDEPGLEPARADVIVGGVTILVALLRRWEVPWLLVSEADILDGLAISAVAAGR